MIEDFKLKIHDERHFRALTGVSSEEFIFLEKSFIEVYKKKQELRYQEGLLSGKRKRRPGGGKKGALPTFRDKLFFVLYYLKVYPTFDVLGSTFGMSRSKANENLHKLAPVLSDTLVALNVMPKREFNSAEEFKKTCSISDKIIIDVTERPHQRPKDNKKQKEMYSGKKKTYSEKHSNKHPQ